jgi:hypothetical protein
MKSAYHALIALILFAAPTALHAQLIFTTNSGTITITGYSGNPIDVTIPSETNGLPVTTIGGDAFFHRTSLATINIPASVTVIADYAFSECYSLKNVTISAGVTTIANYAFLNCSSLATISIPSSVTTIGDYAFESCFNLTDATLSYGLTTIGQGVFYWCYSLTNVFFQGDAPTTIGNPLLTDTYATAYYLPGTTGWTNQFAGIPAVLWNPLIQTTNASFGVQSNKFGFNVTGTTNIPIAIEACDNPADPVWTRLHTLTLTNGSYFFSEPLQSNTPTRFYRISSP